LFLLLAFLRRSETVFLSYPAHIAFDIIFISCLFLCSVSEQIRLARSKSLKMMFFSMCGGCCEKEGCMFCLREVFGGVV